MNSRLRISNQFQLTEQARICKEAAALRGCRAALVIKLPPPGWLEEFAARHNADYLSADSSTDRADRISALLGSERQVLVMQLGPKHDLGLLSAAIGTVKAGGIALIGTYAVSIEAPLQTRQKLFSDGAFQSHNTNQRFDRLVNHAARAHPDIVKVVQFKPADNSNVAKKSRDLISTLSQASCTDEETPPNPQALSEQNKLLAEACHHLENHQSSCIVIKGRRGRGKSFLLARLAHHLNNSNAQFRVTAERESALRTYRQQTADIENHYISPESAVDHPADVLLVDEAATISITRLQRYLSQYRHVVLCTTVEGYEASGRALDVRLLTDWPYPSKALLALDVIQPWRWANNDPLEELTDKLLLTRTTKPSDDRLADGKKDITIQAGECSLRQIRQNELTANETLLNSIHSLLRTTHYQSTSKDLEHFLDAPTVQIWVHMLDNEAVGVLVLEREGIINKELHDAIVTKSRRLPNQLLPQLLAQTANNSAALEKNYLRIIRLAVTPRLRRQKLASRLLNAVTTEHTIDDVQSSCARTNADALGASFAADTCSVNFWRSHGYTEFHRGFRSNPRTGKKAVAMMLSFDNTTSGVLEQAVRIHQDNETARLQDIPGEGCFCAAGDVSMDDLALLRRFANNQRSKHDTYGSLSRLALTTDLELKRAPGEGQRQHEAVLRQKVSLWLNRQSVSIT